MSAVKPARVSAALVVAGAARSGPYDYRVLFLHRSSKTSAFPSFHVFPGGVTDAEDSSPAWLPLLGSPPTTTSVDNETSLKLTAMRECFEECGILVTKRPGIGRPGRDWQKQVYDKPELFRTVMEKYSSTRECMPTLKPVARFITPLIETKRFDTTFFASSVLTDASAQYDGVEAVNMTWLNPEEALGACRSGQLRLMPPQWYIIEMLLPHKQWAQAHAALPSVVPPLQPEFYDGDDGPAMLLPGDEFYSQPALKGQRHRILLHGWGGSFLKPLTFSVLRSPHPSL